MVHHYTVFSSCSLVGITHSGLQVLYLSLSISQRYVTTAAVPGINITEETAQWLVINTTLQYNTLQYNIMHIKEIKSAMITLTLLHCACSLNARSQNLQPI